MSRAFFIFLGVSSILFGSAVIIKPKFFHTGLFHYFDFTSVKWPFGLSLMVIGVICIWSTFRKKGVEYYKNEKEQNRILICPKCEQSYRNQDTPTEICPICNVPLEGLKGFYVRHPEFKDKT